MHAFLFSISVLHVVLRFVKREERVVHVGDGEDETSTAPATTCGGLTATLRTVRTTNVQYYGAMRNMTNGQYYQQSARRSRGNRRIHQGPPLAPTPRANETAPAVELRTKTIRNDVNLKKGSLKLLPVEGKPNECVLEFTFDAATQCFVSVFVNVAEVPTNRCSLHPAENLRGERTCCAKGLRQKYVLPEQCAINVKKTLEDASNHDPESNQDYHHVVIRLETVQDKEEEGHTIQDQPPGSPFPKWVQSQTTYASLEMQDEGHYDLRIKKQKIWVEGTSYELQEIYGIEPVMGEAVLGDDDTGRECVICLSEPRDTTVLPCRHMCMCNKCARMLREKSNNCPICRKPVESLLEIKVGQRSTATEGSSGSMAGAVATS